MDIVWVGCPSLFCFVVYRCGISAADSFIWHAEGMSILGRQIADLNLTTVPINSPRSAGDDGEQLNLLVFQVGGVVFLFSCGYAKSQSEARLSASGRQDKTLALVQLRLVSAACMPVSPRPDVPPLVQVGGVGLMLDRLVVSWLLK